MYYNIRVRKKVCISIILILLNIVLSKNSYCSNDFLVKDLNQNEFLQSVFSNESLGSEPEIVYSNQELLNLDSTISTKRTSTVFTSKSGYFYIQISQDGKLTRRKVQITLSSTDASKSQKVLIKEIGVEGYSDNHNFTIISSTSNTEIATQSYSVIPIKFSYTKPAHYMAKGSYLDKLSTHRFNFRKYNSDNSGSSTINNTGHNLKDITEIIDLQINVANSGINLSTNTYVATNATGCINLNKKYYGSLQINPNGGTHNEKTMTYNYGTDICSSIVSIQNPVRHGYEFTGWTLTKGIDSEGASFDEYTNEFMYCGKSTSTTDMVSSNTCILKANWKRVEFVLPEAGGRNLDEILILIGLICVISIILIKRRRKI